MTMRIPETWKKTFLSECRRLWGLTINELTVEDIYAHYGDLEPKEAALVYGEDNNLDRIDRGWFS